MSDETDNVTIHYHRSFPTTLAVFLFIAIAAWQSGFITATALVLVVVNIVQTQRLRKTVNSLVIEVEDAKNSGNSKKQLSENDEISGKQPQELDASLAFDGEEIFNMLSTWCRELFTELVFVLHVFIWYCSPDTRSPNGLASNPLSQETEETSKVESEGTSDTKETSSVEDKPDLQGNVESASSDHVEDETDLQGNGESGFPDCVEQQLGLDALEQCHQPSETLESNDQISTNGFIGEPLTFGSFEDTPLFGTSTIPTVDIQDIVVSAAPQISENTPSTASSPKLNIELVPLSVNLHHPLLDSHPPSQPSKMTPEPCLPEKVKVVSSVPAAAQTGLPDTLLPGLNPYFFRETPPSFVMNNGKQVLDPHLLKLQDALKRLSPNNADKIFQELQDVITINSKQLPECANMFVEKAVTEAVNQTVVIACAKVISYVVRCPKNGGLKMLAIEISNSLFATLALLLELEFDSQPSCFVMELVTKVALRQSNNRKLIKGIVRFASELFLHDVLELEELRDRLIDPLLVQRTNKSMEILCQILTSTGHRIKRLSAQNSNLANWYSILFNKLEGEVQHGSLDDGTGQCIQRVVELKGNGWDPYLKPEKPSSESSVQKPSSEPSVQKQLSEPSVQKQSSEPSVQKPSSEPSVQKPSPSLVNSMAPAKKKKKKKPKKSNLNEENLAKAACQNVPSATTLHVEIPVVSSDSSSMTLSPASSVNSLPSCHLQSKLIVDIDAKKVLASFMVEVYKPEASIMQWLKSQFKDCEEKRIRDFVRNVGRLISNPRQATEASQIGYLLHLMMKGLIISEDQVIRGLMSGIVSDLPMYHRDTTKDFLSLNKNTAILVVRCWEQRMQDLSWLTALGKHQQKLNKSTWEYFSLAVLNLVSSRMTLEGARKLFHNTESKEALLFAATGADLIESSNSN